MILPARRSSWPGRDSNPNFKTSLTKVEKWRSYHGSALTFSGLAESKPAEIRNILHVATVCTRVTDDSQSDELATISSVSSYVAMSYWAPCISSPSDISTLLVQP